MTMKILAALCAVALAAPVLADTYDVDASHTTLGFGVKHMVVSTTKGKFDDYKAEIQYDPANLADFKASATIQVKSVSTRDEKRHEHLRGPDFFDAAKFPEIAFVSTKLEKTADGHALHGKFTIKGVTKDVVIPVTVNGPIADPWGNQRLGIEGGFTISRKDYGLTWSKTMDGGGLVVGDDVKIELSIEGIKRK